VQALLDLQVEFARNVAERTGIPLGRALLDYTNLYVRFGLGRAFDAEHPGWREYVDGLAGAADPRAWTRLYHARRPGAVEPPGLVATFGCFSYADLDGERLRLHFHDAETDGASPLAKDRQDARRAELAALFAHVRRTRRGPRRVIGRSWLYNLEAYRRLFPAPYLATAHPLANAFRYMPLWGQFATRAGGIREAAAQELRERLARWSAGGNLAACFPLQALAVEASVTEFYRFHRFALI
jgi:hypothetical protein